MFFSLFAIIAFREVFAKVIPPGPIPVPVPKPPPAPKPPKVCGTSFCDSDMLLSSAANGAWHVPNLNQLPVTGPAIWATNIVNDAKLSTIDIAGTSNVKYGGFCAQSQKTLFFMGAFVPAGIPDPSWVANIPTGDLDVNKNLKVGTYKFDVTAADLKAMNDGAASCQALCKARAGCNYGSYGWEAPAGWFCKLYSKGICTDATTIWWKPAPPALGVTTLGGVAGSTVGFAGGCRVTDTISSATPYLSATSFAISSTTPYTVQLPYLQPAAYTTANGIVSSIRCDSIGALTPGWPTFGTVWV